MLLALLPSVTVLLGTMVLMGLHWPVLGLVVAGGTAAYIAMTLYLSTVYVAPAAKLSNALDTRLGGMLADAIGCNPVVKAFGAEAREDERLARTVGKWRNRTRHTWTAIILAGPRRTPSCWSCGRLLSAPRSCCGGTGGRRPATWPMS